MSFVGHVDVIYGTAPDGLNADLLIILAPYVDGRRFYHLEDKTCPLIRLLRDSEVRMGEHHAVIITHLWMWARYLNQSAELAQKLLQRYG